MKLGNGNRIRIRICLAFSFCFGAATAGAEQRMVYERIREPFAAGIAQIRRSLPPRARKEDEELRRIRSMLAFHDQRVAWGEQLEEKPDGSRTIALQNEPKDPAATIVVVTSGKVPEGFSLRTEGTRLWVYEYQTTSAWAGLMILHELSHLELAARSTRAQTDSEWLADELDAYELELRAADLISRGGATRAVREFIAGMGAKDPADLYDEFAALPVQKREALDSSLQKAIGSRGPKSDQEAGLRGGFAMTSVGLVRYRGDRAKLMKWMEALTRAHGTEEIKERLGPDKATEAPPRPSSPSP